MWLTSCLVCRFLFQYNNKNQRTEVCESFKNIAIYICNIVIKLQNVWVYFMGASTNWMSLYGKWCLLSEHCLQDCLSDGMGMHSCYWHELPTNMERNQHRKLYTGILNIICSHSANKNVSLSIEEVEKWPWNNIFRCVAAAMKFKISLLFPQNNTIY